jgi:RNA polymerase sigma factor (sigma-70 family)
MTTEELLKRQDLFRAYIYKRFPHVPRETREDAAAWAVLKWIEGVALKQDFRWLFIDYMRTGLETGMNREVSKFATIVRPNPKAFEKLNGAEPEYDDFIYEEEIKDLLYDLVDQALKGKEAYKTAISMYYFEDFKLKEIAERIKLTESRVSQIVSHAKLLMFQYAKRYKRFAPLIEEGRI